MRDPNENVNPDCVDPFAGWPEDPTEVQLRAEGYDDEAIAALRAAGVLRESKGEPWVPETLDDVDWVCHKAKQLAAEITAIQIQADRRILALQGSMEYLLARHRDACLEIVKANLPRKADGSYRAKFIDLPRVRVKLTATAGGPRIRDEAALLTWIRATADDAPADELIGAVRVERTETLTGWEAVGALIAQPEAWKAKIMAAPVKAYVLGGIDESTGEKVVRSVPGVEIEPPSERFSFE